MHLDRLSALLVGLAPRVVVRRAELVGGVLPVPAGAVSRLHLHLVTQGEVSLQMADSPSPVRVVAPALVVCRGDQAHELQSRSESALASVVCVQAELEGPAASLLLAEFSQAQVLSVTQHDACLHTVMALMVGELGQPRCGQPALLDRAGDILFIGLLRYLIAHPRTHAGLFNGLSDQRIAAALVAMHSMPQQPWSLESLAHTAGMSRTAFATRFRMLMNQTPGKYLSCLRLNMARRAVRLGHGLKRAANEVGFANASALSRALARESATENI